MTDEQKAMRRAWAESHFGDKNLTDEELDCATYMPSENFSDGWDKGVDFALSHQWISVEERLPENDRFFYFVADVRLDPLGVDCAVYTCKNKSFSRDGYVVHPTHWMHIPQLNPEKKKDESR